MNPKNQKKSPRKGEVHSFEDYCGKYFPRRCPHPNCPENDRDYGRPYDEFRECTQYKPIWISVPAGEHVHISCPVHPNGHIIYGPPISFKQPKVTWDQGDDNWLEEFKKRLIKRDPEPRRDDPDYSKIGKVWM